MTYFNVHNHTDYSNIRLLDCINKPEDLIKISKELGLSGLAITDHESLGCHMKVNKIAKAMQETDPDFTIALGNEIYLVNTRDRGQKYYHFILIAKDLIGYHILNELSSIAWYNMFADRGLTRVPLLKDELASVIAARGSGHIIATTACIGGELGTLIRLKANCEEVQDYQTAKYYDKKIQEFITFCLTVFHDDFYIEVAPSTKTEQITVNREAKKIADEYGLKVVVGTDSHYLRPEDRFVHKAYLNSKNGEREVDDFYEFTYVMSPDECFKILQHSFEDSIIEQIFNNTLEIKKKISFYSLEKHQSVTEVEVKDYKKDLSWFGVNNDLKDELDSRWPITKSLFLSDNIQERYWINQCYEGLIDKGIGLKEEYLDRLEEEARVKKIIGEKLETCMFAYPNTLQHFIDLFWRCGSTVGAGRGSACSGLNHYLLGITQLDPIQWSLPFWRYLNDARYELGDIDIDLAPSKLPTIIKEIRKERGELGIIQVCTYGTEGTKSAVLTACRGYRSETYPDGIDPDEAQYISSLVPQERGFLWPLKDLIQGNPEKDRKPQTQFINTVNQYPGLLKIMLGIEGMVCRRGSHASGVIFFDEDTIFENASIMRTPSGALVTQWDLHDQEAGGGVKYDFLLTNVQDIIIQTIELLQKDKVIESDLTLREVYNKYLHPSVLPQDDEKMWNALANNEVVCCFQFDSPVGAQAAKKIKPTSAQELADANGLMRLMPDEKGAELPLDKYVKFKNNLGLWYQEMRNAGLTPAEQKVLEPYFLQSYGVPPSQEQLMQMLMDKDICGFDLASANQARKIVGKKQMSKIPDLKKKVLETAKSPALGEYVWKYGAGPQMGYSFSIIHALAYSFIGMQTLYLATHFNPIYWDTACLIVNSGALGGGESLDVSEEESDKQESTDYAKLAKAIGMIRQANIKISLADINHSDFGFKPDVENNQILFGMKGMLNIGDDVIQEIIANRPYNSPKDFLLRVKPKKQVMFSLIKGGAFDSMMDRRKCMAWYIWEVCDKKSRLTLQNMPGLIRNNLVPLDTEERVTAMHVYEFNRYLKACCKYNDVYKLDERAIDFLTNMGYDDLIRYDSNNGNMLLNPKSWDKYYQSWMDVFRNWLKKDGAEVLQTLNDKIFLADWEKYAKGNISAWEMETLCFYYHQHELTNVNMPKYGLINFYDLPKDPIVDRTFEKKGKTINIYRLFKICGTCIAKNKNKGTVSLLTTEGVITVKFRKEYFALFDKQISALGDDGKKHIVEKSWFNRGSKIVVMGIRSGDDFIAKKYNSSGGHQLYKIIEVLDNGDIVLADKRQQGDAEEEDV